MLGQCLAKCLLNRMKITGHQRRTIFQYRAGPPHSKTLERSMAIHWWHMDKLVKELSEGRVSEDQSLKYALISAALYCEGTYYATWFGGYRSWVLLWEFLVVVVISLIGVHECFKANGGATGSHFLKRFFC